MKDGPLREGLFLLTGLGLLAWPLSLVTGVPEVARGAVVTAEIEEGFWTTDVGVQSAHPLQWMELRRGKEVLGRIVGPATDGEFECVLASDGELLTLAAKFVEGTPETALKLQLWPASAPEVELTFWGEGELLEDVELNFHD